jgi:hypothetical protein
VSDWSVEDEKVTLHSHTLAVESRVSPRIVLDIVVAVPVTTAET